MRFRRIKTIFTMQMLPTQLNFRAYIFFSWKLQNCTMRHWKSFFSCHNNSSINNKHKSIMKLISTLSSAWWALIFFSQLATKALNYNFFPLTLHALWQLCKHMYLVFFLLFHSLIFNAIILAVCQHSAMAFRECQISCICLSPPFRLLYMLYTWKVQKPSNA